MRTALTTTALFLLLPGADRSKQEALVLRYAETHDLAIIAITVDRAAAVQMVADGGVWVVLAAFRPRDEGDFSELVTAAGGRVEYVRSPAVKPAPLEALVVTAYNRGTKIPAIAALLDMDPADVRRTLLAQRVFLRREDQD